MSLLLRSAFVIFVVLLADIFFISCHKPKDYKYKFTRAQFQLQELDSASASGTHYLNLDNDTASADKLLMYVNLSSEILAKIDAVPSLFINSSYAFQFVDNYTNVSSLKHIKLTTLKNYNQHFSAGSNIEQSVLFGFGNPLTLTDTANADNFINSFNERYKTSVEEGPPMGIFWIKLKEKPATNTPQQIAIEIEMEDGAMLRDTTVRFIVK